MKRTKAPKQIAAYRHRAPVSVQEPVIDPSKLFYVTVRDAGRTGWLLGPYELHAEALANVDRGRSLAENVDVRAVWYAFGTAGVPRDLAEKIKPVFGKAA